METVGIGFYFEDLPVGRQFQTVGRTVTETDIVGFINAIGMTEVLFTNIEFLKHESDIKGRVAPGFAGFLPRGGPAVAGDDAEDGLRVSQHATRHQGTGVRGRHHPRRVRSDRSAPLAEPAEPRLGAHSQPDRQAGWNARAGIHAAADGQGRETAKG